MEKKITKVCPGSNLRYALMEFGYEPYRIVRIEKIYGSNDYLLTLELDERKI